jgi:putative membrane protein
MSVHSCALRRPALTAPLSGFVSSTRTSTAAWELFMNRIYCTAIAIAIVCSASIAAADDNPDATFYKKATEGGIAEVELGKLAQDKSPTTSVKEFGAMMVTDHSAANDKLKSIAAKKNIKLPTSPSVAQMATKTKLEVLSGTTFDKSYIKGMVQDHQEDIKEFQTEANSGQDPDAKAYAAATLPTLKAHLKKIRAIAATQDVDVK